MSHQCDYQTDDENQRRQTSDANHWFFTCNHLETFINKRSTPYKYSFPFRNSFFLGVGGTAWETCLNHFDGKFLSKQNKHLRNQWVKFHTSPVKPVFTVIVLGSNSVDQYDRDLIRLKNNPHLSTVDFWKEARRLKDAKLAKLKPTIKEVLSIIRANAPYSDMFYLQILPRRWWHPLSREVARSLDKYVLFGLKKYHRLKDFRPSLLFEEPKYKEDQAVMPGMLDTDETHLNGYGNRALIDGLLRPLSQKWLHMRGACKPGNKGKAKKEKNLHAH